MIFILYIVIFTLVQALLLNHIHIFGVVTPLLYVYFALLFPRNFPKWAEMLLCFLMGLAVDMFSNTPGLAATTMTFIGMLQPYLLELFLRKEDEPDLKPCIATLGFVKYLSYSFLLTFIYCIIYFSLDAFALRYWLEWVESVFGSMILTLAFIITLDSVRKGK